MKFFFLKWKIMKFFFPPSWTVLVRVLQGVLIGRQMASYICGDIRPTLRGLSSASWRLRKTSPKVTWRQDSAFIKGGHSAPWKAFRRLGRDFHAAVGYTLCPKWMIWNLTLLSLGWRLHIGTISCPSRTHAMLNHKACYRDCSVHMVTVGCKKRVHRGGFLCFCARLWKDHKSDV